MADRTWIKITRDGVRIETRTYSAGEVVEVSPALADGLIRFGLAERIDPPPGLRRKGKGEGPEETVRR